MQHNPYCKYDKPQQSVVAFFDILGFIKKTKEAYKSGTGHCLFTRMRDALYESYFLLENSYHGPLTNLDPCHIQQGEKSRHLDLEEIPSDQNNKEYLLRIPTSYMMRIFTDNVVIGMPILSRSSLIKVIEPIALFQLNMVLSDFFLRGGVDIGDLYMDDKIVFGLGLVNACEAEKELACYPRVIFTKKASCCVKSSLKSHGLPEADPLSPYLFKDTNEQVSLKEQVFINYLYAAYKHEIFCFEETLCKHKRIIEKNLEKHDSDPKVLNKYIWVANYHNFFCFWHFKLPDERFEIDLSEYQQKCPIMYPVVKPNPERYNRIQRSRVN